jgi:pantoate ligase / CMP/dCMP kinase
MMNLPIFTTPSELGHYLQSHRSQSIGFMPTMGALHVGHLSAIDRARRENTLAVVSIFVNPLQFGPNEDLDRYPRQLEIDRILCDKAGVDAIFAPTPTSMGLGGAISQVIPPESMMSGLCGRSRPGHFQGVATIVAKLLNIVQPDRAYFGEKDAQQLAIIRRIVADLNMPVEIVACPTIREESGLAYSSRNQYLSPTGKTHAAGIYRSLQQAKALFDRGETNPDNLLAATRTELSTIPEFTLEYLEIVEPNTLQPLQRIDSLPERLRQRQILIAIAGRIEGTRLIDNLWLGIA